MRAPSEERVGRTPHADRVPPVSRPGAGRRWECLHGNRSGLKRSPVSPNRDRSRPMSGPERRRSCSCRGSCAAESLPLCVCLYAITHVVRLTVYPLVVKFQRSSRVSSATMQTLLHVNPLSLFSKCVQSFFLCSKHIYRSCCDRTAVMCITGLRA